MESYAALWDNHSTSTKQQQLRRDWHLHEHAYWFLPNEVFYRDLDGNTRKVHVSYSWKPQRCQHCLSFGHANEACQQTPKQITKVYRPRQAPQQQSESSLMAVAPMVAKTIEHSDSQGQHRGH